MSNYSKPVLGKRVLIIDDDEQILLIAKMNAKRLFEAVHTESQQRNIPTLLKDNHYDVVVLDMNLSPGATSGSEGLHWLREIKKQSPETQVIVSTAFGDIDLAVSAMKLGALDFVTKPWEPNKFFNALNQGIAAYNKVIANQPPLENKQQTADENLLFSSKSMTNLMNIVSKVAPTEANILILGENGTGKDIIAQEIHKRSARAQSPFIKVDIGTIQESLFESELFGHVKGAFTDAKEDRIGRFEAANGGTLFLDEIGNLPLALQTKLLTALQNRVVTRVGSNSPIHIDIRLVCATNASLTQMIRNESFRQDLYYRIKTVEIDLPPLRHRGKDIPLLAKCFLQRFNSKYDQKRSLSEEAMKALSTYHWPGNVRELENLIESAVIVSPSDIIGTEAFIFSAEHNPETAAQSIDESEIKTIKEAIKLCDGNLTKAASQLGIGRATLYRKIDKYGI